MKQPKFRKILKTTAKLALLLLLLSVVLAVWFTYRCHTYVPADPEVEADPKLCGYFRESYDDSRKAFLDAAASVKSAWPDAQLVPVPVATSTDDNLSIDILYVESLSEKQRLLVLSSGVHGAEGYVGSAVQRMFLDKFLTEKLLQNTGVLLVHAVNPHGFRHCRRVNQNNVDLNRNCIADPKDHVTESGDYSSVTGLLNPEPPVNLSSAGHRLFPLWVIGHTVRMTKTRFRQGVMGGQYDHPQGIVYGGRELEPQIRKLGDKLKPYLEAYPLVMNIDLHTGHGGRGTLHLLGKPGTKQDKRDRLEQVFEGHEIDWPNDPGKKGFYKVKGDFSSYLGTLIDERTYLPMTFEYGTMNSATSLPGGIKALHLLVLENQGVQNRYASTEDKEKVEREFRGLFFPSSLKWRTKIMNETDKLLESSLEQFAEQSHSGP